MMDGGGENIFGGLGGPEGTSTKFELWKQGAEARIYKCSFMGRPALIKERFEKKYRHPELDRKMRNQRTLAEVRAILKCRKLGLDSPVIFHVDFQRSAIVMEAVDGHTMKDALIEIEEKLAGDGEASMHATKEAADLMQKMGKAIAMMHNGGIVHGDLTTSNFLLRATNELVMIDFGLSFVSTDAEDLAVDLYVLERAFISTHPGAEALFKKVLNAYNGAARYSNRILTKLEDVRRRGRKREMIG